MENDGQGDDNEGVVVELINGGRKSAAFEQDKKPERSIEGEFLHTVTMHIGQLLEGEMHYETRNTVLEHCRLFYRRLREQLQFAQRLGYHIRFKSDPENADHEAVLGASLVNLTSHQTLTELAGLCFGGQRLMLLSSPGFSPGETFDPRIQTVFLHQLYQKTFGQWQVNAAVYNDLELGEDGLFYGGERPVHIPYKVGQPWPMNSGIRRPRGILLVRDVRGGRGGIDPSSLEGPKKLARAA